jgi:hypothetical protein
MKYFIPIIFVALILSTLAPVQAQNIWEGTSGGGCNKAAMGCTFCDALIVAKNIIKFLSETAFAIAVVMIVYGAIVLMTAGGSEERVTKGKGIITNAVIGLVIALAAWLIINELLQILSGNPTYPWSDITCT